MNDFVVGTLDDPELREPKFYHPAVVDSFRRVIQIQELLDELRAQLHAANHFLKHLDDGGKRYEGEVSLQTTLPQV